MSSASDEQPQSPKTPQQPQPQQQQVGAPQPGAAGAPPGGPPQGTPMLRVPGIPIPIPPPPGWQPGMPVPMEYIEHHRRMFMMAAQRAMAERVAANGGTLPPGMQMPPGMQFPPGMKMPPGMQFPPGMKMPPGMQFPPGMKMPPGMQFPPGMKMPPGMMMGRGGPMPTAGPVPYTRGADIISSAEWDTAIEKRADRDPHAGRGFRRLLIGVIAACIALLAFAKWDLEMGLDLPDIRGAASTSSGSTTEGAAATEEAATATPAATTFSGPPTDEAQLELYYEMLEAQAEKAEAAAAAAAAGGDDATAAATTDAATAEGESSTGASDATAAAAEGSESEKKRKQRLRPAPAGRTESEEEEKQRRLENWHLRKKMRQNMDRFTESQSQLVHCGKSCQDSSKQMQLAYDTLVSQVDRELYGVLMGEEEIKKSDFRKLSDKDLREAYHKKKAEVEETETDSDYKEMALAELKDAWEIASNSDARNYYLMYGRKPPEAMRHVRATHGGWGQELAMRTFRNRLVFAWLNYFNSASVDYAVILVVIGVGYLIPMIFAVPKALEVAQAMVDEQDRMAEMDKANKAK